MFCADVVVVSLDVLTGFGLSVLLLSLSPGPSNLYIMACTLSGGRVAGVAAAGGMAVGSLTYTLLVAFGLASLILLSPLAFILLKLCGAGYLIFLGLKSMKVTPVHADTPVRERGARSVLRQSIIVELTNPKTGLFFIAFLPQFASPQAGNMAGQLILLGLFYALIALCCDLLVVSLSGQLATLLNRKGDGEQVWLVAQQRLAALILLGLGSYILIVEVLQQVF
ncbi:LysE family translocator [Alteromonas sp. CYL-A6]|uniref:LysE family translocator n=1 Tax=Alteromonas nitratireducens TaxID=3390813 RepID=UPI0034BFC9E2